MILTQGTINTWHIVFAGLFIYYNFVTLLLLYLDRRYPALAGFDKTFTRNIWSDIKWGFGLFFICLAISLVFAIFAATILPIFDGKEVSAVKPLLTTQFEPPDDSPPALAAFLWYIIVPFYEEIFNRGFIQDRLSKLFNPIFALFAQAIYFALGHHFSVLSSINIFCMGIIFGYWRYKRQTLLPVIMAHSIWNLASFFVKGNII